ncbi:MAG: tyrosine-type recombinase/integrase, partial [Cyanobacteria bacterium P01_A01_bin.17]
VIQEQQRYIRKYLGDEFDYLFCANGGAKLPGFNPVPRLMLRKTLPSYLNKLSEKHDFRGENGEPWHFQTHQFRHTVGTRMINNGVPQSIVQRYLGHESPEMTATYARIHDKTMKAEIEKFQGRVVNIAGEVVESKTIEADNLDLQWVKRNIQAQALPNGTCALPVISKGCPHANACLTCTHFRTSPEHLPTHKQERDTTVQIIAKAEANSWTRMKEMNEKKLESLNNIITALEGGEEDGCQT